MPSHELATIGALLHVGRGGHETRTGLSSEGRRIVAKMRAEAAPEDALERLEHEAAMLAHLSHVPGIVRLLAYDRRRVMLISSRAAGASLDALRKAGALPRRATWSVALRLFRILRRVHREGIVHRDIAPGNVLFDPGSGVVTLCDFGQAVDTRRPTRFQLAWRDVEVGTPAFRDARLTRDARTSDVWVDYVSLWKLVVWIAAKG